MEQFHRHSTTTKRIITTLSFLLLQLSVNIIHVRCNTNNNNNNAYKTLGLSTNTIPQKDIRQKYRELCLQYHPDKNVQLTSEEQIKCEDEFKRIQTAYSEIGDEQSRRDYDLKQKLSSYKSGTATTSSSYNNKNMNYNTDDILRSFFEEQSRQRRSRGPAIYFNGIDISNLFSSSYGGAKRNPFSVPEDHAATSSQQQQAPKSIYEQEISIPLQDLYNGLDIYKFEIKDSIVQRYKAAYRGGIIHWLATKGLLTFFVPLWFKSNNLPVCLFLFVGFIHTNLPRPDTLSYETSIQRGWKSGTKLKFLASGTSTSTGSSGGSNSCDVVFILKEERHDTFVRKGNDLYTNVAISESMAKKGCKVVISPLGKLEDPIKVLIPRGGMRNSLEKVFAVKGRGWPKKRSKEKGDLFIHVRVIPDSQYYKNKTQRKRKYSRHSK